jgi:hypothetical protein
MAPNFNLLKTLADAVKEGIQNIFPAFEIKPGRPKETTTETTKTPDEEMEQSTSIAAAFDEAHREPEQPSPSYADRQKREDPSSARKDVTAAPTEAIEGRVNWSEDNEQAKLRHHS